MKRIITVMVLIIFCLCPAACSRKTAGETIREYTENGYEINSYSSNNDGFRVVLESEDPEDFIMISVEAEKNEFEEYSSFDWESPDYEQKCEDFLYTLSGKAKIRNLNDLIMSEEEISSMFQNRSVKEIRTLENYAGYSYNPYEKNFYIDFMIWADDGIEEVIRAYITVPEGIDPDTMTEDEINSLQIDSAELNGFE